MRVPLKELLEKLAVGYVLSAYETCPWSVYDAEKGLTCSAEVRMNNDGNEIEAELQLMYDEAPAGKLPVEQVFWMYCKPLVAAQWGPTALKIKGKNSVDSVYNWEEKGCNFFAACIQELKMDKVPDIDELLEREITNNEKYAGSRQGGGSKAPKIKPQALLGLKNGRGF